MRQERRIARVELPFRPIGEYPIPIRREETIVLPAAQDEPGAERNQFGGKGERGLGAAPQTRAREKMLERVARNMEPRRRNFWIDSTRDMDCLTIAGSFYTRIARATSRQHKPSFQNDGSANWKLDKSS